MTIPYYEMDLRVRYVECDMQGRVFNGHYLTWVDMAGTDALTEIVGGYSELLACGIDYVVAAAELQFRQAATFDDRLLVQVSVQPSRQYLATKQLHDPAR
ncbi:acyl-CoA thioesterase [[Mycobacterium] vasticus]|uniref:Acyl-CoA thioesterase n=1 Tax=[Mycobacterium] vasticus TaxID=2875777 RepID=A0ABU5Z003_9MYCO|nr:acyl-CoA thioesterase [Mycolicibacter sp. MYC017]MEB3070717.1 acyl-CoA thioesterase [Mycolicibacter sp. MYC017]